MIEQKPDSQKAPKVNKVSVAKEDHRSGTLIFGIWEQLTTVTVMPVDAPLTHNIDILSN